MNRKILIPALTIFVGSLVGSCEPKQTLYNNNVRFDIITVTKTHHLKNDSTQPSCNLRIQFVYPSACSDAQTLKPLQQLFLSRFFGESYADLNISEAIDKYAMNYVHNYEKDADIFFSDKAGRLSEESYPDNYFSYYETLSSNIMFNKAGLLSFRIIRTNFKADKTNSFQQSANYVYNLNTSNLLTEDSIFGEGYEKVLNMIFKDKLLEANNVETINRLESLGYFGIEEIMPNGNFLVNEKGMTYTFNRGEYSALQLDEINIFLSFEEIGGILKENSPLSILY
jgi:hypothetical protein